MSSIFISHSSKDNESAEKLRDYLADHEYLGIFLDFHPEKGIPAGRDWVKEIHAQLRKCRAVVLLLSKDFVKSKWCFAEVSYANSLPRPMFPIKLDDVSEKELKQLQPLLSNAQTVDVNSNGWEEALARLTSGLLNKGLDPKDLLTWKGEGSPYPGLLSFQKEDAAVFFGRDEEIKAGIDLLNQMQRHDLASMALILGASGSGKSSLMRAGILPRLGKDKKNWLVIEPLRPKNEPIRELSVAIVSTFKRYNESKNLAQVRKILENTIKENKLNDLVSLMDELRISAGQHEVTVLISIDQMEELIGVGTGNEQVKFLSLLRRLLEAEAGRIMLLGTLRSDFLGIFQQHPSLQEFAYKSQTLGPIPFSRLAEVIEKPAVLAGINLEPGLTQRILHDTKTSKALPLLAFTLRKLHDKFESSREFAIDNYLEIGGLGGSVIQTADEVLRAYVKKTRQGEVAQDASTFSDEDERILKQIFLAMVRMDEGGQYARQSVREDKLNEAGVPTDDKSLVQRFVDARLFVKEKIGEEASILEIAHEALFTEWPQLKNWLEDSNKFLLWRRHLQYMISLWEQQRREKEYLLTIKQQQEARQLLSESSYILNQEELEFIYQSELEIGIEQTIVDRARELIAHSSEETVYEWLNVLITSGKSKEVVEEINYIEYQSYKHTILIQVAEAFKAVDQLEQAQ
ncbi:MAG: toll/interleukin-1 receptor domain-containing protein, partial [Cyclobacteriaceae bacterium]